MLYLVSVEGNGWTEEESHSPTGAAEQALDKWGTGEYHRSKGSNGWCITPGADVDSQWEFAYKGKGHFVVHVKNPSDSSMVDVYDVYTTVRLSIRADRRKRD